MRQEQAINWRRIPWLNAFMQQQRLAQERHRQVCNSRKYHVASKRITSVLLLGGSVEQTLTWSAPFDSTDYVVEWALFDLEGQATITELSRTTSTITVRVTGGVASIALGATYMAFGRSL